MKVNLQDLMRARERFSMVSLYDYVQARAAQEAGVDSLLVGDSLGMMQLGYGSTRPVTMDQMITATQAVVKGAPDTYVVADMPMGSYECGEAEALHNAFALLKLGGADAVKVEGGSSLAPVVRALHRSGVEVIGHVGLTPQSLSANSKYRIAGKTAEDVERIASDVDALLAAGASSVLLEAVTREGSEAICAIHQDSETALMGIGAGAAPRGQLLLSYDILGLSPEIHPKFAPHFVEQQNQIVEGPAPLYKLMVRGFSGFHAAVTSGSFPTNSYTYTQGPGR